MKRLKSGKSITDYQTITLLNEVLDSAEVKLKGYVLDLPFYKRNVSWAELIRRGRLHVPKGDFSYIVELEFSDDDIRVRAQGMRYDPETGERVSLWERLERKKPKPKKVRSEDDDEEEGEVEEEEPAADEDAPNKPKILDESKIVQLPCDMEEQINTTLDHYNSIERTGLQMLIDELPTSAYINVCSAAGLTPVQLLELVLARMPEKDLLRPLALSLEPEGDFKALLTQGLEENAIPRRFSPWRKVDPVALYNGKIEYGTPEQATVYAGHVFVHATENTKKEFMEDPKKYLQKLPYMPKEYRVAIIGQKGSGKHTQAENLSKLYGWKIFDLEKMIKEKIEEFKTLSATVKANNPETQQGLWFSQAEFNGILQGKGVELKDGLVFMLEALGIPMEKRKPPKPQEEEGQEEAKVEEVKKEEENPEEEEKKEEEKKEEVVEVEEEPEYYEDEEMEWVDEMVYPEGWVEEKKEEEVPGEITGEEKKEGEEGLPEEQQKEEKKEEEEEKKEEEEEEIIYEDLAITDLVAKEDEKGQLPFFGGYILLGLPNTEEEIQRLKEMGIQLDKIIFLSDMNEENPNEEIRKRVEPIDPYYSLEADAEYIKKTKALCNDTFGEGVIIDVDCNKAEANVLYQICAVLDPFFTIPDNPELVARTTADLPENSRSLPRGEYADFCPVTLKKERLLIVGDVETEVSYKDRTYRFAGQNEMEEFKINPAVYIEERVQRPPEPHIMLVGCRGSGVTTQLNLLAKACQLPVIELKDGMLQRLEEERLKRKEQRRLLKGFRPKPPGNLIG